MGTNICLHVYDVSAVLEHMQEFIRVNNLDTEGKDKPGTFFFKTVRHFGVVHDGLFYVVWNEYYDEYNPASEWLGMVKTYYGYKWTPESKEFWPPYSTYSDGANALEVLEQEYPKGDGEYWEEADSD